MPERRRHKRRHLIYYLEVFDDATDRLIGHVVDMTVKGIRLTSEEPIELNSTLRLRIDLPAETRGKTQLKFDATSLWTKKDVNPDYHCTGFELQDVSLDDLNTIKRVIARFKFKD